MVTRASGEYTWTPPPSASASATRAGKCLRADKYAVATGAAYYVLRLNAVHVFWLAYILTRPLGASIGDFMSQHSPRYGGLGLGTTGTSYIFLGGILALVTFLSITKRDQTTAELEAA